MSDFFDGGPAFPVQDASAWQGHGLTKREWFAGQALVGCFNFWAQVHSMGASIGDPDKAGITRLSYEYADAMLEAGAEPKPDPVPQHLTYDAWTTPALEHLAIKRLAEWPDFADLPPLIRDFVAVAASEIQKSEDGIPF